MDNVFELAICKILIENQYVCFAIEASKTPVIACMSLTKCFLVRWIPFLVLILFLSPSQPVYLFLHQWDHIYIDVMVNLHVLKHERWYSAKYFHSLDMVLILWWTYVELLLEFMIANTYFTANIWNIKHIKRCPMEIHRNRAFRTAYIVNR